MAARAMDDAEKALPPPPGSPAAAGAAAEEGAGARPRPTARQPLGYGSSDSREPEVCCSVLRTAPGLNKRGHESYANVTPWVIRVFFVHTYYAYIYVFYMFVLAFYKGYALEYPEWRRWSEMVLIMFIPAMQHLRFYFGYWGCELGMAHDLCFFLLLCSVTMWLLLYFLCFQAYIMPLDSTFLFVAILVVILEGLCGSVNALQTLKLPTTTKWQMAMLSMCILNLLAVVTVFVCRELRFHEALMDSYKLPPHT